MPGRQLGSAFLACVISTLDCICSAHLLLSMLRKVPVRLSDNRYFS